MDKKKNIFRKTSLDKISSPERLTDYIKVSTPSIWIILGAIAALLTGLIIWGFTVEITADGLRPIDFLIGY